MSKHSFKANSTSIMIKPVGPSCNLECGYCYYLPTHELFDKRPKTMPLDILESTMSGFLDKANPKQASISWQGGEPTIAGLSYFEKAMKFQEKHKKDGQVITNALQTNGTLLDDAFCTFLKKHDFLVGLSIDGRREDNDNYRKYRDGRSSYDDVLETVKLLDKHGVKYNLLCVLNDKNIKFPLEIYRELRTVGENWIQFIPAVEWIQEKGVEKTMDFSANGKEYGTFLCTVFDEWFAKDREKVSVRIVDSMLQKLVHGVAGMCMYSDSCHGQLTVEHDGSVFACDHFVEEKWRVGQVEKDDNQWMGKLNTSKLEKFFVRKSILPKKCNVCKFKSLCFGGCLKHRSRTGTKVIESKLCDGYKMFFKHALPRLEWLASYIKMGTTPPPIGHEADYNLVKNASKTSPNDPCPCGSGKKHKKCCG